MNKDVKRRRAFSFFMILLTPFLCSFAEDNEESREYWERRFYEKEIIERFTDSEVSIQGNPTTVSSSRGRVSSYFDHGTLDSVEVDLDGLTAPVWIRYRFDGDESLNFYSNGFLTLERKKNGKDTSYLVNGENALSIYEENKKVSFAYPDGEVVSEEVSEDGKFRVLRDTEELFSGVDGEDGMLKCDSSYGLREEWAYDDEGEFAGYYASDGTRIAKSEGRWPSQNVEVEALGRSADYESIIDDYYTRYSKEGSSLKSDYDDRTSTKYTAISGDGFFFDMTASPRDDKPLGQIGTVSSQYASYEALFDGANRVSAVMRNNVLEKEYEYDGLGRLISTRDDRGWASRYEYDDANNITRAMIRREGAPGEYQYTYRNGLLESVNGDFLAYDKNGNVTSFGKDGFQWDMGSLMTKAFHGDSRYYFQYDAMRNPIVKENGSRVLNRLIWQGRKLSAVAGDAGLLAFLYDAFGAPIGFCLKEHFYVYCKNTFQDVVAIIRDDGKLVAEYAYGDFGESAMISDVDGSGLAFVNPFRYRSYFYDQDLELYHLQSRWYSPELRRFLNPDSPEAMLDKTSRAELILNRYSYCANDPITYIDSDGKSAALVALGGCFAAAFACLLVAAAAVYVVVNVIVPAIVDAIGEAVKAVDNIIGGDQYDPITPPEAQQPVEEPAEGGGAVAEPPVQDDPIDPLDIEEVAAGFGMILSGLSLAEASAQSRSGMKYTHSKEWHHVIPKAQTDSFFFLPKIRDYMKTLDPNGVNMQENLLLVSTRLHRGLHTRKYVDGIAITFYWFAMNQQNDREFYIMLERVKNEIREIDVF